MVNSDDLRFFHAIVIQKSLAAASRYLNVTPPSVTQRLKSLESKLSVKLLNRRASGIELTDEGRVLYEHADRILSEVNSLQDLFLDDKNTIRGSLNVLAPLGFGNEHIAKIIGDFQKLHPQLSVELKLSDNPNWDESHLWDMIIYIGDLRDSSLKLVKLASNKRFICASPKYLELYGIPKNPKDLVNYHCIALRENSEDVTLWRFRNKSSEEAIRITPKFASNEGGVVKNWAIEGLGIIMRSEWDVQNELEDGQLVRIFSEYSLPSADIVALLGNDMSTRTAKTRLFLDYLKQRVSEKPWLNQSVKI